MNRFYSLVGIAAMFLIPARMIWLHGRTWDFGPHGLPVSILSPDGTIYRDGSAIDPYSEAIIRSGMEEPLRAALLAIIAGAAYVLRKRLHVLDVNSRRRKESEALLALSQRYEQEGRWQDAQRVYESYRQSLEAEMAMWRSKRWTRRLLDKARKNIETTTRGGAPQ